MVAVNRTNLYEWSAVLILFLIVAGTNALIQPKLEREGGRGYDGVFYARMAEQMAAGQPVSMRLPFVYRVGTPFLAQLALPLNADLITNFQGVNLVATLITTLLMVVYLRFFIPDWRLRVVLILLYLLPWHAPVRYVYSNPVIVDYWMFVFLLVALILFEMLRRQPQQITRLVPLLTIVCAVGVAFREVLLLLPIAALFVFNPIQISAPPVTLAAIKRPPALLILPLIGSLIVFGLIIANVVIEPSEYGFDSSIFFWFYEKRLPQFLLGWFIAYGSLIVLVLYNWRDGLQFLREHQHLAIFTLGIVALGWLGGTDTERFLYWGMPVLYVLLGRAIVQHQRVLERSPFFVLILLVTWLISQRVFLLTPGHSDTISTGVIPLLTVFGEQLRFVDLHSLYAEREVTYPLVIQHLALTLVLLFWFGRVVYRDQKMSI